MNTNVSKMWQQVAPVKNVAHIPRGEVEGGVIACLVDLAQHSDVGLVQGLRTKTRV